MELPNRKQNRLSEFDYGQRGSYFVTLCTHNHTALFQIEHNTPNAKDTLPVQNLIIHKWITQAQNKFPGISIDKYVIMSNHLHFLVTIKEQHTGRSLHYF